MPSDEYDLVTEAGCARKSSDIEGHKNEASKTRVGDFVREDRKSLGLLQLKP